MNSYAVKDGDMKVYSANKAINKTYAGWKKSWESRGFAIKDADKGNFPDALKHTPAGKIMDKTTNELFDFMKEGMKGELEQAFNAYMNQRVDTRSLAIYLYGKGISTKAVAMVDWYKVASTVYYAKEDALLAQQTYDSDFTSLGEPPHTFRETLTEILDNDV